MPVAIKLLVALLIPIVTGFSLLACFPAPVSRPRVALTIALSYGLGIGILAQWMLVLGAAQVPYSMSTIAWPLIILSLGACYFRKKTIAFLLCPREKNIFQRKGAWIPATWSFPKKFFFFCLSAFILYSVCFVFWRAYNVPVVCWDEVSTVAYKAKIFFYEKGLYKHSLLPKASYPLQTSFLMTWTALNLGSWDEILVKLFFPISFLFFLIIQYDFVASLTQKRWAWASLGLLLTADFFTYHATIAYRDFTVLFFNCSTILLLLMWERRKDVVFLLMAGFYSGFMTFTKLESTGYWIIHLVLFLIILNQNARSGPGRLQMPVFAFVIPSAGICFFYYIYKMVMGIAVASGRNRIEIGPDLVVRAGKIIYEFSGNLFLSANWGFIWFLLLLSFLKFSEFRRRKDVIYLLLSLGFYFILYFGVSFLTPNFISLAGEESNTVLSRIILHFFPLAVISIILIHAPQKEDNETASTIRDDKLFLSKN